MNKRYPKAKTFRPKFPNKYRGNVSNIIARSSWEYAFMWFLDQSPVITQYSSEEIVIPYFFPIDKKWHRYFPDFFVQLNTGHKFIIEIKPFIQRIAASNKRNLQTDIVYIQNQCKWEAAQKVALANNMQFIVLDEYDLKKLGVKILINNLKPSREKLLFEKQNPLGQSLDKFISPLLNKIN